MPISSIAQVLLRLFAMNWAFTGLVQLAQAVHTWVQFDGPGLLLLSPTILMTSGGIVWRLSPRISRALARGNDGEFALQGITQVQLHTTMFVGLGMYFTLYSFANVFSWIHFFSINQSPDYGFHRENSPSYYSLTENGMTLAAGIALIFTARRWAEKLCGVADRQTAPE